MSITKQIIVKFQKKKKGENHYSISTINTANGDELY